VHETKFRWALESIRDDHNLASPQQLAKEALAQADALDAAADERLRRLQPGDAWPARPPCECGVPVEFWNTLTLGGEIFE